MQADCQQSCEQGVDVRGSKMSWRPWKVISYRQVLVCTNQSCTSLCLTHLPLSHSQNAFKLHKHKSFQQVLSCFLLSVCLSGRLEPKASITTQNDAYRRSGNRSVPSSVRFDTSREWSQWCHAAARCRSGCNRGLKAGMKSTSCAQIVSEQRRVCSLWRTQQICPQSFSSVCDLGQKQHPQQRRCIT